MKKVLCLASIAAVLALNSYAKDYGEYVHGSISSASVDGEHKAAYTIGYGITKTLDNKVFFGVAFDGEYSNLSDGPLYGAGTDFKLGYNVWDKVNAYGILGAKLQSVDGNAGYGLGYGLGVDYPITRTISAAVEYKNYNMNASNIPDYDYKTLGLNLKYAF
ncbi:MAG: outer membrane beta-barrel protein [Sulfurospirillum sp.]